MDWGIVVGFRKGDPSAVRELYQEYGRLVYAVAFRILGNASLAEDATQQTFLQAWRAAGDFDVSRDPGPWLATIARRAALDMYRRESRRPHESIGEISASRPGAVAAIPDGAQRAYDVWEVRAAVEELPAEEREVVRMQHLEGFTHSEIAERLAVPVGTVKSRSSRAHRRLAARLGHLRESLG